MARTGVFGIVVASASIAALLVHGCSNNTVEGDGGMEDGVVGTCLDEALDQSSSPGTAVDLAAGQEATGYICPTRDQDYYRVTVPAGARLLRVKLSATVAESPVQLTYRISRLVKDANGNDEEKTVGTAPAWTGGGIRLFDDHHCLDPGTYYIVVFDDGHNNRDTMNPYKLSYTTAADPDKAEPNNSEQAAKAPGIGYISCKGDVDYFKVSVGTDQLLQVALTTTAATEVDLRYTIYDDKKKKIAQDQNPNGMLGPTSLKDIYAVPKPGTYYIVVEDVDGDDSDPAVTYTLSVTMLAEIDPGDKGTRNDTSANATKLGTFNAGDAPKTFTHTGQIASKGDVDYFKIDGLAGISADNPAVIEVVVSYNGPSEVDPSVGLIYPDKGSPCTLDACCNVLQSPCTTCTGTKTACTSDFDCLRQTYSCINKGDIFCGNPTCAPNAGLGCATERACAGAVTCLGEKLCGAEQVVRYVTDGSKGATVRTAQPLLHPGPWYIRVNDHKNDDYKHGQNYTLTVKIRMDPDGTNELNSEYFPVLVSSQIGTTDYHVKAAKNKAVKITLGQPLTGYISYEGDQDWYLFDHPCPGLDCILRVDWTVGSNCPGDGGKKGEGLELVFELRKDKGSSFFAFPKNPLPGVGGSFGAPAQCLFAAKGDKGYIFTVSDLNHNNWSWSCGYTVTITKVADGCVSPCSIHDFSGNCTAS